MVATFWRHWIGIGAPGAGKPYPVIIYPRKGWLLVRFLLRYEDLVDPPSIAYSHEPRAGVFRTRAKIKTPSEVEECLKLLALLPGGDANGNENDGNDSEEDEDA
jgi:hypothetical protein